MTEQVSGGQRGQLRGPSVARGAVPAQAGCVVIDKPAGLTSHDVVGKVRRLAATKKVGHAGTLDPMATGVLVVGIGAATRLLTHITGTDKEYVATIRLGIATTTDDAEGEVVQTPGCKAVDPQRLKLELAGLTGQIMQVPATVSAIKVDGVRSYARVRAGQEVELAARPVTVTVFELTGAPRPATVTALLAGEQVEVPVVDLEVRVVCSAGTYIRALARDLGRALGSAGHLTRLRRTRVGCFTEAEAVTLEQASAQVEQDATGGDPTGLAVRCLTDVVAAQFPVRQVDHAEAEALRRGMFLPAQEGPEPGAAIGPDGAVALLRRQGKHDRPYVVFPANIEDARKEPASMTKSPRPKLGIPRHSAGVSIVSAAQPDATQTDKHSGCGCGGKCGGGQKGKRAEGRDPIGLEAQGRATLSLRASK